MSYINMTKVVLISYPEKDHNMIETHCLKNVIFIQTFKIYNIKMKQHLQMQTSTEAPYSTKKATKIDSFAMS